MKHTRLLASLGGAFALAFASSAHAQNPNRVSGMPFINGVNVPWNAFGMDFGTHPSWGAGYDANWWNTMFTDLKNQKVNVARVWLHCDGRASPEFNSSGDVTGIDSNLIANLQDMLDKANANGVKVQLCLWSFDMGKDNTGSAGSFAGLHGSLITNTSYRSNYITKALNPILDGIKDKPALFCIEAINEPEWMISENPDANAPNEVTKDQMRAFVQAIRDAVKAKKSSLSVTVGAAAVKWASANGGGPGDWWSGLNLDHYDIHYYDWQNPYHDPFANGKTPAYYGFEGKPCVIGEFGGNGNTPYSSVADMYERAWNNGYAGLMPWSYKGVDSEGTWNDFKATALNFANSKNLGGSNPTPTPTPTQGPTPTPTPTPVPGGSGVVAQAEAGTLVGCSVATSLAGYTGTGFVNGSTFDASGDKFTVNLSVTTAGSYTLRFRYAGVYGEKRQDVYVNGVNKGNIAFPSSTSWSNLDLTGVALNSGSNSVEVRASWGWTHFDSVEVVGASGGNPTPTPTPTPPPAATPTPTPTPTPSGGGSVTVQVEAGTLTGCSTATSLAGYQGSSFVNGATFDADGDKITVTVNLAAAGNKTIRIRYAGAFGEKYQDVYVNGVNRGNIQFPSGTTWATKDVTGVPMNAGNNTIEIRKSWGWTHFDSIEVF
jgi:hypothetical protein